MTIQTKYNIGDIIEYGGRNTRLFLFTYMKAKANTRKGIISEIKHL